MPTPIVDADGLRKSYRSLTFQGRRQVDAVRGVSLQAYPGEVFGLLGPNGAGKTTLIKMLLGVVRPSGGRASLFGQPIGSSGVRSRVGYLPESLRVDRHHTARSALRYYGRMSGMSAAEIGSRSEELLRLVGLEGRDRESVRRFSKGMYQRLGLAQALLHDPDLLVLDEPTDGLDPVGRNEVRRVMDRLRDSGKTIFLNSHILQEVELVCTRVAILARGQIRAMGTIDDLTSRENPQLVVDVQMADPAEEKPDWAAIIDDDEVISVDALPAQSLWRLSLEIAGQAKIDHVVDQIRSAGLSIRRLEVRKDSLEETFIRLVGDDAEDAA